MTIKKLTYLAPLLVALLPLFGFSVGQATDQWALASCLTPFVLFVIVPLLDWIIGHDLSNPSEVESAALSEQRYYRLLTMLCFPAYLCTLLFGAWVIANVPMSPLVG